MSKPNSLPTGRGNNQTAMPKLIRLTIRLFIALCWFTEESVAKGWRRRGGHGRLLFVISGRPIWRSLRRRRSRPQRHRRVTPLSDSSRGREPRQSRVMTAPHEAAACGGSLDEAMGNAHDDEQTRLTWWQRAGIKALRRKGGRRDGEPLKPDDWEIDWRLHETRLGGVMSS